MAERTFPKREWAKRYSPGILNGMIISILFPSPQITYHRRHQQQKLNTSPKSTAHELKSTDTVTDTDSLALKLMGLLHRASSHASKRHQTSQPWPPDKRTQELAGRGFQQKKQHPVVPDHPFRSARTCLAIQLDKSMRQGAAQNANQDPLMMVVRRDLHPWWQPMAHSTNLFLVDVLHQQW